MSDEDLQNDVVESQEVPESVRPDYVPEEYWANGQVDVKKMTDDLAMDKKRIDDLRRIISTPKKPDPYDTLFDDRELNDYQKEDMSFYVQLANKNGLSKKQAEQLYDDVTAELIARQKQQYETAFEEAKKDLGSEYQNVVDGLKAYATNQVKSGAWKEEDKRDFENMAYNARSMRILTQLINNQPKLNLSGGAPVGNDDGALTKELYDLSSTYHKMVKMGRGDEPAVQEMKNRLNKLQSEYNQMIDRQGVSNVLY